jgi:FlaA1/EpsC-like NDP-sugar epimerase
MPQEDCVYSLVKSSLDRGEDILLRLKADKTPCLIFGAGFLGSLVAAELEGQVQGFVDDNEMMYTDTWTGLPIHCLLDVRSKTTIVVAVPPSSAVRVAERCRAQGHSVEVPFHL